MHIYNIHIDQSIEIPNGQYKGHQGIVTTISSMVEKGYPVYKIIGYIPGEKVDFVFRTNAEFSKISEVQLYDYD